MTHMIQGNNYIHNLPNLYTYTSQVIQTEVHV